MKFLSVCSGIEAASVAWHGIFDALAFCEYEAFPSAVLAHRYPETPNMGDLTKWRGWPHTMLRDADILVGGTPCQAFSIAGLRNSLADDRGNLSLEFVRLANAIDDIRSDAGKDPGIILWENVPGVLSVKDNAFGNFLAALAGDASSYIPPRGKWTNAGVVAGPARTVAWIVKDAQYFGVAQRRRRVFVVASARAGFDPAAVLFECEGVRRDTPPRREKGQAVAAGTLRSTDGGSDVDHARYRHLIPETAGTLDASLGRSRGAGTPPGALHPVIMAHGQANAEIRTDGGAPALTCLHEAPIIAGSLLSDGHTNDPLDETLIAHSLRGEGFDASEDGTGRGTPLVPVAYRTTGNDGVYETGEIVHALTTNTDPNSHVIGFSSKDHGADATEDLSPTLRAMPHHGSHANGGGQMAVAVPLQEVGKRTGVSTDDPRAGIGIGQDGDPMFTLQAGAQHGVAVAVSLRGREGGATAELGDEVQNCLRASQGGGDKPHVLHRMAVRRLTPVECERLQGFPDGYTNIPWRGKPEAPDGPRYKALGNSMAVPVMRWIGQRIAAEARGL